MLASNDFGREIAHAVIVLGKDGKVCLLRSLRGSKPLTLSFLSDWGMKQGWKAERLPTRIAGLVDALTEAHEQYAWHRAQDLHLSADSWLTKADALAGRIMEVTESGIRFPKVVTVYVEKKEVVVKPEKRKKKTPKRRTCIACDARQLSFFSDPSPLPVESAPIPESRFSTISA